MRSSVILALMASVAVSCNFAAINYDTTAVADVAVSLHVDWPESGEEKSEQMYIAAARTVNSVHFTYLYPEFTAIDAVFPSPDDADAVQPEPLPTLWPHGRYFVLAFTKNDELYNVSGLSEFAKDTGASMKNINLSLPVCSDAEKETLIGEGIIDYNSYLPIVGDAGHLHVSLHEQEIAADLSPEVRLEPEELSQHITIKFSVKTLGNVEISRMNAFLSGVVGEVCPMTGVVNHNDLYRVNIPVTESGTSGDLRNYEAEANILGLFPNELAAVSAGRGILQLIVYVKAAGGSEEEVFYAGINLKNVISETLIMETVENDKGYRIAVNDVVLNVSSILTVSENSISGTSAGDGVDKWFENKNIDTDI